jgi:hypothetical protein
MKALIGGIIGALLLGGVLLFVNGPRTPALASGAYALTGSSLDPANDPLLVNCGEGRQALVRPVAAGQRFSQIECVPAMASALMAPGIVPAYQTYSAQPALERVVYRERPVVRTRAASSTRYRETVRHGRSWKKSALIIGGSAAGGAGLGAIVSGKSGAGKGAIIGGVGGLVYDLVTRNK